MARTVTLDENSQISLADIEDVAFGRAKVALAESARRRSARSQRTRTSASMG